MSTNLMTLPDTITPQESFRMLNEHGRRLAPVVASDGTLVGIVTKQSALRATLYKPALDANGKLRVGAAIGINGDVAGRAQSLSTQARTSWSSILHMDIRPTPWKP